MEQLESKVVKLQDLEPLSLHNIINEGSPSEVKNALKNLRIEERNEYEQTALHIVCELGRIEIAQVLLGGGANASAKDGEGITPLIAASKHGSASCVKLLVQAEVDVNATDNMDWTALMWASYKGHSDIVHYLLARGANVDVLVAYNMTPLLWAAGRGHTRVVRLLLEKGAKVNAMDKFGSTPLIWASRRGFVESVQALLEYRVDMDSVGANGANALISAIQNGHEDCVKLLLSQGPLNVNHTDNTSSSALGYAAKLGKYETIIRLLDAGAHLNLADKNGKTPLIKAVKNGHLESVRALLSRFADVDIRGKHNATALHHACELGHVAIVREILACSPDTEAVNDEGETPLLRAVKNKHVTITKMLLDCGAKVTATDKKLDTPLHIAIRARSLRIAKLLLRNPQDGRLLYQPNKAGETPYNIDASHDKSILGNVFGAKNMSPETTMQDINSVTGIPRTYDLYSSALADVLCEPTLTPPLTVGLYAKWGSGKSFLLQRLEKQMQSFTSPNVLKQFERPGFISFLVVTFFAVFFGLLAATLTPSARTAVGAIVACTILGIYCAAMAITGMGALFGNWSWADWLWNAIQRQYTAASLLFKLWFMIPPRPKQMEKGKAIPVRFLFTNYSRLTSVGGETSLAEMIGLLTCDAEKNLGFFAVRFFRAFSNNRQERGPVARFKKICCIPNFVLAILFCLSLATIILLAAASYGPEPTLYQPPVVLDSDGNVTDVRNFSPVDATMLVLGALNVAILCLAIPTLFTMCGALIWSQRKRVLTAAHHTKSQERLMQQLKHEVDLLCHTVIAIDAFTNTQTRMCVNINGLDSCEQDKVLQVLDTVHILFSQRPYITILAIDPVIISKAINESLTSAFRAANISGHDYLRNVVHLPFYLKDKGKRVFKLRSLTDLENERNRVDSDNEIIVTGASAVGRFASGRRPNGPRRTGKSVDVEKLMFSEDWFNTMSPQLMKRILHIVSLTGRFLRADSIEFSWAKLAAWINLTEQWPYRTSFVLHILEKSEENSSAAELLRDIYEKNYESLNQNDPMIAIDSSDERSFRAFLTARCLTVHDVIDFCTSTVNLDPKLIEWIRNDPGKQTKQAIKSSPNNYISDNSVGSDLNNVEMLSPQPATVSRAPTNQSIASSVRVSVNLLELSTEDVANHLFEIKGLSAENAGKYANFVRMNNINGHALLACDLDDLKKELFAPFGDWCLLKQWIQRMRLAAVQENESVAPAPYNPNIQQLQDSGKAVPNIHGSSSSIEFEPLYGEDRLAYDNAFKEYLRLQPDTESSDTKTVLPKVQDLPSVENSLRSYTKNGTDTPPNTLEIDVESEGAFSRDSGGETSPLLILHSHPKTSP